MVLKRKSGPDYIRIKFGPRETGWAVKLPRNKARIANIPLENGLNIDDVVQIDDALMHADALPRITKVLKERYACKTALRYPEPHEQNYQKVRKAIAAAGAKCEGIVPGVCVVAHHKRFNPVIVCKKAKVDVTLFNGEA